MSWWRKPSPEAEAEKNERDEVKSRLTKVERRVRMLDAQVNVLRRDAEEDE